MYLLCEKEDKRKRGFAEDFLTVSDAGPPRPCSGLGGVRLFVDFWLDIWLDFFTPFQQISYVIKYVSSNSVKSKARPFPNVIKIIE